jgi:predicted dehydrogenase
LSAVTIEVGYAKDLRQLGGPEDRRGAAYVFGCYGLSVALHLFGYPNQCRTIAKCDGAGVDVDSAYLLDYDHHLVSIVASIGATLSNEIHIYGSRANIVVPAPFLDATERSLVDEGTSAWARRAKILSDPITKRLPATRALRGSGLRGEAAEVMRCLDRGLRESPEMPLEHTLAIHRLMATASARKG